MAKSGYSFVPAVRLRDRYIDPVTFDYARNPDGSWVDSPDARSAVIIAFRTELGASPFDPGHGTSLAELARAGELIDPNTPAAEAARVGAALAEEGILADLEIEAVDPEGNSIEADNQRVGVIRLRWRDLTSGATPELIFNPYQQEA